MTTPHDHCWHADGNGVAYDYTSVWIERCCHCPAHRTMQRYRVVVPGHGPYADPVYQYRERELPDDAQPWELPSQ
jgi:hypothetical protein